MPANIARHSGTAAATASTRARIALAGRAGALLLLTLSALAAGAVAAGRISGDWELLPILSGSMRPTMPTGSLALATPEPIQSVRRGQIIVFRAPIGGAHLTAHRVLRVLQTARGVAVVTKGDANRAPDPWTAALHGPTVWVITASVPILGYVSAVLRGGLSLVVVAVLLAVVAVCLATGRSPFRADARPGRRRETFTAG